MESDHGGIAYFVGLAVVTAAQWLVYTGLLWGMIKVQKLNYNALGLFGSSLAATLVGLIPYGGSYLSYVVLVLCLWKCTKAEIVPDVVFTVIIAGALMFCVNLWVIGALMGDLRPGFAHARDSAGTDESEMADMDLAEEDEESNSPAAAVPVATNAILPKAFSGTLALKGITFSSTRPSVMISDGTSVHIVGKGETFTATLPQGRTRLRCEDITKTSAVVKPEQGEVIVLRLP